MKDTKHRLALLAALLTTLLAPVAAAQLIVTSQTNQFNIFATNAPGSSGFYFSFDVLTRDFDKWSGPQSLLSVELTISGRNTGSFFVGAFPPVTVDAAVAQQNFSFVGGGGPPSIFDPAPYSLTTAPGPLPQSSSVGMFNLPDGPNAWQLNGTYTYTDPSLLASYFTGPGAFQLRLNNLLQIYASGGTPIGSGLISTGDVIVTLTAVPEPSTCALLALAAAGLGGYVMRRRR